MANKEPKLSRTYRLRQRTVESLQLLAEREGVDETQIVERLLSVALGIKDWPKPPRSLNKAKKIVTLEKSK